MCERERLAHLQDFLSIDLITEQWISRSIRKCITGRGEWPQWEMKPNVNRLVLNHRQSAMYPRDYEVRDVMALEGECPPGPHDYQFWAEPLSMKRVNPTGFQAHR